MLRMGEKFLTMIWMMMSLKTTKVNIHTVLCYTRMHMYFERGTMDSEWFCTKSDILYIFLTMFYLCSQEKQVLKEQTLRKM